MFIVEVKIMIEENKLIELLNKYTVSEIAKKINCSTSTIYRYKNFQKKEWEIIQRL